MNQVNFCRKKFTNRPLETREQRQKQETQNKTKYDFTVIRVYLTNDNMFVQLQMTPDQTIRQLFEHLWELIDPNKATLDELYLFTVPPKTVIPVDSTFEAAGLVPAAFLLLGGDSNAILNEDVRKLVSNFDDVARYTAALRKLQKHM